MSMELWAAAKKALSWCGDDTSSCPSCWPKATCPECHVSQVGKDKGDNKMILGAVHRSPDIYLTDEENP